MITETLEKKSLQTNTDCILCLALDIAEGLLKNGDSVRHVEETIIRICTAYGGEHVENFCISTLLLASLRMKDGSYSSQIRRVYSSTNNMSKLEDFNALSRRICDETPDFETAQAWLRETKKKNPYPKWLSLIGYVFGAFGFALFFGGSLLDGIACALIGLTVGFLSHLNPGNINALAKSLILSFISGLLAYLTVLVGLGQNVDVIMIGSIMLLIPGLAFGNALRDLLCGDILTGMLKTVQSCLTAVLIAFGFSGAILIMANSGVISGLPAIDHPFPISLLAAALGTVAFAAVFCVRPKCLPITALGGGAVFGVYFLAELLGAPEFISALACAVFGAAYSEVCARLFKVPAIVFLTPALISIVPGGSLYYTMSALLSGNTEMTLSRAAQTLYISSGLVAGTIIVSIAVTGIRNLRKRLAEKS